MKKMILIPLLVAAMGLVSGCFQAHSDDDLRGVPVTNNPHLIPQSSQTAQVPGYGQ